MVEVADVDPVREDAVATDLDVHVAVDRVLRAEDVLVADAQVAFVAPDRVSLADENPPSDRQPSVDLTCIQLDFRAEEDEAFRLDVWLHDLQADEAKRAHPVAPGVQPARDDETDRADDALGETARDGVARERSRDGPGI